ncbi:LAME_0G18008g1_1 [Lachancea meyersii CBS 8951]|uniref:LAME_0G18008g1_1 n=1 Tax=Lachancea meyersii CBS 8951 TaxID=1266667 RepID=A0A1G4KBM6_9SACH|nr:LAME_0G18008g1_1 [Lachancea meyersii CBS 8951]
MRTCSLNGRIFCLIIGLFACAMEAKNVAHLDVLFDPTSGKFKRQLPSSWRASDAEDKTLKVRDARNVSPLNLDELFEKGSFDKREVQQQNVYAAEKEQDEQQTGEAWDPICLDSRLASMNEISIFTSYLRDDVILSRIMCDPLENVIVFAPSDRAVESLPKKPWQFPTDVEALEAQKSDEETIDRAVNSNIQHFVQSHIATSASIRRAQDMKDCMHDMVVLRSFAFEGDDNSGDIMLMKQKGEYYVAHANSVDEGFQKVHAMEQAQNGIVFTIWRPLISA